MKNFAVLLAIMSLGLACCGFSSGAQSVTVQISSPVNGATLPAPVHVRASAKSLRQITGWKVYVDSVAVYTAGAVTSIDAYLTMAQGNHHLTVKAWNSKGASGSATDTVTVSSTSSTTSPLTITTTSLPGGTAATAYSATLSASGGTPPYTWTVGSGQLPPGVALSSSGTISGNPTTSGQFTFSVGVRDSATNPQAVSKSYALSISAPAPASLTITVNTLKDATVGTPYSTTLTASGGTPPYSWTLVAGALPPGLNLASAGSIAGTPTTAGQYPFTVLVKDSATTPQAAQASLTISVATPTTNSAIRLFKSGFDSGVSLAAPANCGSIECYQQTGGTDASTGSTWPPNVWGSANTWGKGGYLQLYAGTSISSSTISNYVVNQLQTVTGHTGSSTTALYQGTLGSSYEGSTSRQDPYVITPDVTAPQGDLYIREWINVEPDLKTQLIPGQFPDGSWGDWRVIAEWKTGGQAMGGTTGCVPGAPTYGGDYRIIVFIIMDNNGNLFWRVQGDNNANGNLPVTTFWQIDDHSIPVPVGQWFKFEWFWHRSSGSDGRVWAAINGQVIADRYGSNIGAYNCQINRIVPHTVYTGGHLPAYQWVDDLEIWNTFPADASSH